MISYYLDIITKNEEAIKIMNFLIQELTDMIFVLGASDKNCLLAQRIYQQKFPDRRQPRKETLENLLQRFTRTGSVAYEKSERLKNAMSQDNEMTVMLKVTEDPHISTREISKQTDISRTVVQKILSKNKMHPYRIQRMQELLDDDYEKRLTFCEWAQERIQQNRDFFNFVLFADEATFHKNGFVNRHNFHYYATDQPHCIRTISQTRWSLNVWGGIIGNHVIGPYFFDGTVNGQVYLNFLQNELPQLLQQLPAHDRRRMWYLHDGAPVHHTQLINTHLNNEFPGRWIGRGGPHKWPPRSPDLTKMDFFWWGYVKEQVYKTPATTKEDMKNRIREVFRTADVNMLHRASRAFEDRIHYCMEVNGGHFEHLIK